MISVRVLDSPGASEGGLRATDCRDPSSSAPAPPGGPREPRLCKRTPGAERSREEPGLKLSQC